MIRGKARHQLFPHDELIKRLAAIAKSHKRASSDLLVEMVDARINRRAAPPADDHIMAMLDRIARAIDEDNREAFIISHSLHQFMHFQLLQASALPVAGDDAKALGQKRYDAFLDSLARMIAGGERSVTPGDDEPQGSKP